jgi:hypothetical protein
MEVERDAIVVTNDELEKIGNGSDNSHFRDDIPTCSHMSLDTYAKCIELLRITDSSVAVFAETNFNKVITKLLLNLSVVLDIIIGPHMNQ